MPPRTRSGIVANNNELDGEPNAEFKQLITKYQNKTTTSSKTTTSTITKSKVETIKTITVKSARKRSSPSQDDASSTSSKKRKSSAYAPPSKYSHLKGLTDSIAPNLLVLFVGHNPGVMTAATGHAYAHPSNHFWKLLHASGLTDRRCSPTEDGSMPELYSLGLTNIVARPTKDTAELSKEEQVDGTPIMEEKVRNFRPEVVCIVGKSIWEAIWKWKYKRPIKKGEFEYGWQDERHNIGVVDDGEDIWPGAKVFVATTTSGLAASLKPAEKEAIWKPLGDWAKQRRIERAQETDS